MGPGTVNVVPHSHYPTKDGRWIAIASTNDKIFARLVEAMAEDGLPAPEPWAVLAARERDRAEVDAHVGAWRSEEPRVGKEGVSPGKSRWTPAPYKKNKCDKVN